jgi:predicted transposase/invertase (TIGR01784 family)
MNYLEIDFSQLMDLRVDYAFKLLFGSGDTASLISLLNAVFADKKIPRIIKSLTIVNPHLEKRSKADKLSILDIKAQLDDASTVLIEMHLYDLKYKTIRSWARVYGEGLKSGKGYFTQPPVICVAFVNDSLDDDNPKIHKCCKIVDIDDHTIFSDAMELHYINMKMFVDTINDVDGFSIDSMLAKWLAVITEKDIADKSVIKKICMEQEDINMAVSTLARLSEDQVARLEYETRLDEVMLYNERIDDYKRRAEQESHRAEQEKRRAEQAESTIANKDNVIADKDAIIAQLRAQLDKK